MSTSGGLTLMAYIPNRCLLVVIISLFAHCVSVTITNDNTNISKFHTKLNDDINEK